MNGREVFRHAVTRLAEAVEEALAANGLTAGEIDWLVPHQANLRIIDGIARRLGLGRSGWWSRWTATPTPRRRRFRWRWPGACADGRIAPGQLVLLEALGGGLTWGSALVRL